MTELDISKVEERQNDKLNPSASLNHSEDTIIPEEASMDDERKAQKRKEFEIKINVIITEMRKYGTPEVDIFEYVDELRAKFEEELRLTPQELALKRKQEHEENVLRNQKAEFKRILELYFQVYIDYDSQYQSPEEIAVTKEKYAALIRNMVEMSEEELEIQYDNINKGKRSFYERYNKHTVFKECLEKEVALKLQNKVLTIEQVPEFRSKRIKSFLAGEFDYPDLLKDNVIQTILASESTSIKLVDLDDLPDVRSELEEIKLSLNNPNQQNSAKKL